MKPQGLLHKSLPYGGNPTCGKILLYAKEQVECMIKQVGKGLCIFKIGITTNPLMRYPSYLGLGYTTMWLIHVSGSLGLTLMLEASLIANFQDEPGCRNKKNSGGEGAMTTTSKPKKPPFFVYVVGGRADQPRRVG